ncbi:hypothetical protein CFP65_4887 [Kitasatospora sp. MMS16-BH015]|uniref:helix-turn-helix domain-containing protein n=1 Tax=Kitasatospora sp. MMS16-BH015 TaxID=2018025 RepID=UPI000CA3D1B2|nr:helix-turn-helix domain-containing protein [Kitasatospora sp. MMS16-BH015]AUG79605.1 hypothetical protein CFP65_4887 [Kitasatospora sp. MMS16-BH015]
MGRQEQPLDAAHGPLALFALELRELRRTAGSPPYRRLAASTNYSASTLAEATAGRRLPSEAVLAAFVTACGGDPAQWEQRRLEAHRSITEPVRADEGTSDRPGKADGSGGPNEADEAGEPDEPLTAGGPDDVAAPAAPAERVDPPSDPPLGPARGPRAPGRRRPAAWPRLLGAVAVAALALLLLRVPGDSAAPGPAAAADQGPLRGAQRWLRPGTDIPAQYRDLIVAAGTACPEPEVTPALIAAVLKAESGFDPNLSDPAKDEYGIARWTPRVLRYYLPADRRNTVPTPPFTAEDSILAVGRMLCAIAPELRGTQGDPELNLAAAYQASTWAVRNHDATRLATIRSYLDQVAASLPRYRPS